MNDIIDFILQQTKNVLAIDSPTGFTSRAADYVMEEYRKLGYAPVRTNKGGILVCVSEGNGAAPIRSLRKRQTVRNPSWRHEPQ